MGEIDPELLHHMMQVKESLGRIEAKQESSSKLLESVDVKVQAHIIDVGAHGIQEKKDNQRESSRRWNTISTTTMAVAAFSDFMWRMFHKSVK